jgi:hypothetical protein
MVEAGNNSEAKIQLANCKTALQRATVGIAWFDFAAGPSWAMIAQLPKRFPNVAIQPA